MNRYLIKCTFHLIQSELIEIAFGKNWKLSISAIAQNINAFSIKLFSLSLLS